MEKIQIVRRRSEDWLEVIPKKSSVYLTLPDQVSLGRQEDFLRKTH